MFHIVKVLWALSGGRVPDLDVQRVIQVARLVSCSLPAAARFWRVRHPTRREHMHWCEGHARLELPVASVRVIFGHGRAEGGSALGGQGSVCPGGSSRVCFHEVE